MVPERTAYLACMELYDAQPTLAHWRLLQAVSDLVVFVDIRDGRVRHK